jgi:hypothetical protein
MKITKRQLRRIIRETIREGSGPLPMDITRRTGGYMPGPEKDPFTALRDDIIDLGLDAESTFTMLVLDLKLGTREVAENFPALASILSKIDQQTMIAVAESL